MTTTAPPSPARDNVLVDVPQAGSFYSITEPPTEQIPAVPGKHAAVYTVRPRTYRQADGTPAQGVITAMWSGTARLPAVGERVTITFNGFGAGVVRSYFVEAGYLGIEVAVDVRPEWHIKQHGEKHRNPLVFGAEITVP